MAADLLAALILAAPEDRALLLARIRERNSDDDHPYGATRTAASGRSHLSASDARKAKWAPGAEKRHPAQGGAAVRSELRSWDKAGSLLTREEVRRNVVDKAGELTAIAGQKREDYVNGAKRLVLFHAQEATKIAEKYGWQGKNPHAVQMSLFGDIGMHAEPSGQLWEDFTKWYAHQESVTTLGTQAHVLGAIA